jgi:hypothetical protein
MILYRHLPIDDSRTLINFKIGHFSLNGKISMMNLMCNHRHSWKVVAWITAIYICAIGDIAVAQSTGAEPYLLGNLTTRAHNVSGVVYLVSNHIIEIRVCQCTASEILS